MADTRQIAEDFADGSSWRMSGDKSWGDRRYLKILYQYQEADVAYLLRREDNPRYKEEGFYDPTCETEWHKRL